MSTALERIRQFHDDAERMYERVGQPRNDHPIHADLALALAVIEAAQDVVSNRDDLHADALAEALTALTMEAT